MGVQDVQGCALPDLCFFAYAIQRSLGRNDARLAGGDPLTGGFKLPPGRNHVSTDQLTRLIRLQTALTKSSLACRTRE